MTDRNGRAIAPRMVTLPPSAAEWFATGERGISSESIFSHLTGLRVLGRRWQLQPPRDPADLRRCRQLLESVPEFQVSFHLMSEVSSEWAAFVAGWDELCALMDSEVPNWRDPDGDARAPRTYERMVSLGDKPKKAGIRP